MKLITIEETAEFLNVSKASVFRLIQRDPTFPAYRCPAWRVDLDQLKNWVLNQRPEPRRPQRARHHPPVVNKPKVHHEIKWPI